MVLEVSCSVSMNYGTPILPLLVKLSMWVDHTRQLTTPIDCATLGVGSMALDFSHDKLFKFVMTYDNGMTCCWTNVTICG